MYIVKSKDDIINSCIKDCYGRMKDKNNGFTLSKKHLNRCGKTCISKSYDNGILRLQFEDGRIMRFSEEWVREYTVDIKESDEVSDFLNII